MSDNKVNDVQSTQSFGRFFKSVTLSSAAALGISSATSIFLNNPLNKSMIKDQKSMSVYENEKFNEYFDKGLAEIKKQGKRVCLVDMSSSVKSGERMYVNYIGKKAHLKLKKQMAYFENSIINSSTRSIPREQIKTNVMDAILHNNKTHNLFITSKIESCSNGQYAITNPLKNNIFINRKKYPLPAFHETGHLLNGKFIGYSNLGTKLVALPLIFACAILKKSQNEDNNENNPINFIKKHCVGLTFLTQLPTLLDEGIATLKGIKLAKKVGMDSNLLKKMCAINGKGYLTYIVKTLALTASVFAASKIRDII